jgi:hypothetical protein
VKRVRRIVFTLAMWCVAACGGVSVAPLQGGDAQGGSALDGEAPDGASSTGDAATTDVTVSNDAQPDGTGAGTSEASSDSTATGSDATAIESGVADAPVGRHPDGAVDASVGVDASTVPHDGTTGKPCASNADCIGTSPGAPGINVCSSMYSFMFDTQSVQLWPTPVCLVPLPTNTGNCDPGPAGTLQFCDGADPNDLTSPGLCVPVTTPQTAGAGNGVCIPSCSFAIDGSPAAGCPGKDTCVPLTFLLDRTSNTALGVGFCQGTCETDADCSALGATFVCQQDIGFCTRAAKVRTKTIGAACTNSPPGTPSDSTNGACNCFDNLTATTGYCTSACVVGGAPCPNGYVCESLETPTLTFQGAAPDGGDLVVPGPPMQTPGLSGVCMAPCPTLDSGSCPPLSSCVAGTIAGPDCQPM